MKLRILALIFKLICSKNTDLRFVVFKHFHVISMIYNKEDQHMVSILHSTEIELKSTIVVSAILLYYFEDKKDQNPRHTFAQ